MIAFQHSQGFLPKADPPLVDMPLQASREGLPTRDLPLVRGAPTPNLKCGGVISPKAERRNDKHLFVNEMKKAFSFFIVTIFSSILFFEDAFPSGLRCDLSQDNRTYIWNLKFDCDREITPKLSWGLSSSINSTLIKKSIFSGNKDRWQEDGKVNLNLDYLLTPKLKIGVLFSQNLNSLENRKVTTSDYGFISEFNLAGISFIQVLGAKNIDRRFSEIRRSEKGFNYSQTISFSPRIFSGSITQISLKQTTTRLKNIPILQGDVNLSFLKYLSDSPTWDGEKDSIQVTYHQGWAKKKFFAGNIAAPQINTQKKNQRVLNLRVSRRIPWGVKLDFDFDFLSNRYRYSSDSDTLLDPLLTDNFTRLQNMYLGVKKKFLQRVMVESFYKHMRAEEDYAGKQIDQEMEGGELGGEVKAEITSADSLRLTASIGVTSFYAPPFLGQFNDRDVLTALAWGEYLHIFNPYFNFRVEGGFRNFHQLYVSDRLSSNNNHNQTYLFSPSVTWQPDSRFSFKQIYNIQANYIYYDYEKIKESTKNKLFRRASSTSEVSCRYNNRLTFSFGYIYKYEDYGQLEWRDQWVQKISWDRRTNTFILSIDYQPVEKVSFSPEYSYERRKSWDHVLEETPGAEGKAGRERRILADKFYRNIISFSLSYFVNEDNYLYLSATHRLQNGTQIKQEIADYVTVSVARVF
ncbi:MAG: hypothetical protein ACE5KJ_01915 [Candidatus Zixiibacteriota bacterium]